MHGCTGRRVFEEVCATVPYHPRSEGRPERCSRADDNELSRVSPRWPGRARKSSLCPDFLVKDSRFGWRLVTIFTLRTIDVKKWCVLCRLSIEHLPSGSSLKPKTTAKRKTPTPQFSFFGISSCVDLIHCHAYLHQQDDDGLVVNPPTPYQICKHPPAPKKNVPAPEDDACYST